MNNNILKSVAGASIILTLLGFLSKGIGFIREIVYANKFGLSIEFDLFLISFTIPNLINTATIYLCQHYFIPAFNDEKKISISNGKEFFIRTFWIFTFLGLLLASVLFFLSDNIVQLFLNSHAVESKTIASNLFSTFLITVPINSGMAVIMAYQQAKFNFVTPAISLTMMNVTVIAGLLFLTEYFKIYVLPLSFAIGYILAFGFLLLRVKGDFQILPIRSIFINKSKNNFRVIVSLIFIEGLSLSYVLIDRLFISEVSDGGISALNYAFVVFSLPISLFSIPLVTTLFSKFSSNTDKLIDDIRNAYGMIFYIMLPVSFLFYFWGDLIFISFYEGGKFSSANTIKTFSVLKYYSFGLVFISIYHLFVKIFYSIKKYDYVMIISVSGIIVKIVLSALLVNIYKEDGLALSTTLLYAFLMFAGTMFIVTQVRVIDFFIFVKRILLILMNLFLALILSEVTSFLFNMNHLAIDLFKIFLFLSIFYLTSLLLKEYEIIIIRKIIIEVSRDKLFIKRW